jgi:putative hemolysin
MERRTGILILLTACLVAGALIAGCAQQAGPSAPATTQPTTGAGAGIANPASVNCINIGGTLEIKTDATGGQYGMCTFKNGTSCEEWALFRGEGCKSGVAATPTGTTNAVGLANPASVNCEKVGGKVDIKKDATGAEYGMCLFPNGTSCEEWALFRGEGCKDASGAAVTTTAPVIGMPNPAAVYCGDIGGTSKAVKSPDGSEYGMCVFTNGTACEEWALYRHEGCMSGVSNATK